MSNLTNKYRYINFLYVGLFIIFMFVVYANETELLIRDKIYYSGIGINWLTGFFVLIFAMLAIALNSIFEKPSVPNDKIMVRAALINYAIVVISIVDIILESWGLPGSCGGSSGFDKGNCLLLDGLSTIGYVYIIIPVFFVAGTLLFIVNYRKKLKASKNK